MIQFKSSIGRLPKSPLQLSRLLKTTNNSSRNSERIILRKTKSMDNPSDFPTRNSYEIANRLKGINSLRVTAGDHKFLFRNLLAEIILILEKFVIDTLLLNDFKMVSVPEIVDVDSIRDCGFNICDVKENKAFRIKVDSEKGKKDEAILIATSEIPLSIYSKRKIYEESELPIKYFAISNCFRMEAEGIKSGNELYRLRQFKKIEMYSVLPQCHSTSLNESNLFGLKSIIDIQYSIYEQLFDDLQLIKMPISDLNQSALHKLDIETWMQHKSFCGELTSASYCSDFQAKNFKILYRSSDSDDLIYAHTINGTAMAFPRVIMKILEKFQATSNENMKDMTEQIKDSLNNLKPKKLNEGG
ncbi:MAG: Serine--tRNA ligase, mitochondrial [Marteilia pararefringens]